MKDRKDDLAWHLNVYWENREFYCTHFAMTFPYKEELDWHLDMMHKPLFGETPLELLGIRDKVHHEAVIKHQYLKKRPAVGTALALALDQAKIMNEEWGCFFDGEFYDLYSS